MEFGLSEELTMLQGMVRGFAAGKIAPYADEWDAKHYFPHDEVVKAWIQDIEKNYASVLLEVSKDYEGNKDLLPKERPFPPDQNAAITYAQATLQETGRFEGFLPTVTAYSFGEQELTLMPEGPRSEIPRTTTRVSLEHLESKG